MFLSFLSWWKPVVSVLAFLFVLAYLAALALMLVLMSLVHGPVNTMAAIIQDPRFLLLPLVIMSAPIKIIF